MSDHFHQVTQCPWSNFAQTVMVISPKLQKFEVSEVTTILYYINLISINIIIIIIIDTLGSIDPEG